MGSIMRATSDGFVTSPIQRGAWISKNIVGTTLSPPPLNVVAFEPNRKGPQGMTIREQLSEHMRRSSCHACHKSIDPYGLALESFDPSGRWRDTYRVATAQNQKTFVWRAQGFFKETTGVDPSGELDGEPFQDVRELKRILAAHPEKLAYNLAKQFFHYANGYEASLKQRIDLHRVVTQGEANMGLRDIVRKTIIYSIETAHE
jgi:hypothetical protein